ncbi:polysaccharide deacetylase family protein [Candidatus Poribacteria bacterium]|nr:polysaccharide deacetylase family protein [Candidatus Poribacteria bacterium]
MRRLTALSIDLEDWYHPELVVRAGGVAEPTPRIEQSTGNILSLLRRKSRTATFFVLGEVAERHPELVKRILADGHEIASHGMSHKPLWRHDAQSFAKELGRFENVIHSIVKNVPIRGFRAPTFSLDFSTAWALDVLADNGYVYDSSVFPMKNRLYGVRGAPLGIYRPLTADLRRHDEAGRLIEFPPAVLQVGPARIPVAGGSYFRLLPTRLWLRLLRAVESKRPAMIYVHPWECDPLTPRVPLAAFPRFVTYYGIRKAFTKLEMLLDRFHCARIDEVLGIERD